MKNEYIREYVYASKNALTGKWVFFQTVVQQYEVVLNVHGKECLRKKKGVFYTEAEWATLERTHPRKY